MDWYVICLISEISILRTNAVTIFNFCCKNLHVNSKYWNTTYPTNLRQWLPRHFLDGGLQYNLKFVGWFEMVWEQNVTTANLFILLRLIRTYDLRLLMVNNCIITVRLYQNREVTKRARNKKRSNNMMSALWESTKAIHLSGLKPKNLRNS